MTGRVSRACDGCRVRKVRCNGAQPCSQCEHLSLKCIFAPPPGKRKPGVRGRLVAQLRNSQQNETTAFHNSSTTTTTTTTTSPTHSGGSSSPTSSTPAITSIAGLVNGHGHSNSSAATSPQSITSSAPSKYNTEYFLGYMQLFEEQVYPFNPVITPAEIQASIYNMHNDFQDAALVYAYGAITINLTQWSWTENGDLAGEMTSLMNLSLAAHKRCDYARDLTDGRISELEATLKRIMTLIYLEISIMAFKRHDRAFALLREAITMIQLLNVHQILENPDASSASSSISNSLAPKDIVRLQRAYWELYIHERFLSTVTGLPCILPALESPVPIGDTAIPQHIDVGYNRLVCLFRVLDGPFLAHWSAQKNPNVQVPDMTAEWIERKQAELDKDEADSIKAQNALVLAGNDGFTERQLVDLLVTRLWLRTLIWQFALSHGLLRSAPPRSYHDGLSLHFPAQRTSVELRNLVSRLGTFTNIVIHGSGILQKLFEITSTVADVLALPLGPGQSEEEFRARLEDFEYLIRFIFNFKRIQKEQRDYLREKLDALQKQFTIIDFTELASASPGI